MTQIFVSRVQGSHKPLEKSSVIRCKIRPCPTLARVKAWYSCFFTFPPGNPFLFTKDDTKPNAMLKKLFSCFLLVFLCVACDNAGKPRLGISFGVGPAKRWPMEMTIMVDRARELGMDVDARLNKTDTPKTQTEDCIDMIDNGISTLILVPRDANKTDEILDYARKKNVKVLLYARTILGKNLDFFVGYDTHKIGQSLGSHLSEKTYKGSMAILKGDANDFNVPLLNDGAMKYFQPLVEQGNLKIILDENIAGWSPEVAHKKLTAAIRKNNNQIDAVFAHNDIMAGVVKELGIKNHVVKIGMDAELPAIKRLVNGTQDATVYMDLKSMATTAANEAYNLATGKPANVNAAFDNKSASTIKAFLINGKIITRENIDKQLIDTGVYTREEVYGK